MSDVFAPEAPETPEPKSLFRIGPVLQEYPILDDIFYKVMPEVTPQALLRDLHRPEKEFRLREHDIVRHELSRDGGRAHFKACRAEYFVDLRVPITELVPTTGWIKAELKDLKRVLALPWADAPKIESLRERIYGLTF